MVDIPGNSTTTVNVTVGSTTTGTLDYVGDHDWYRIQLVAGQSISVAVNGVTLVDPFLTIRNAAGTMLYEHDDISSGVNRNSLIGFTATTSGTYYIDVGSFEDGYAGDFQLVISTYSAPPVGTVDQMAYQLTNGYWDGGSRHFNVTQGGNISVNLSALTGSGQTLAREALALWSDVIGVTFREVSTGGQITFDDNEEGAFSNSIRSGSFISSSQVNVSTEWLADYGTGINSYAFQTYVHEIGHALGLGHGGDYNEQARYPFDASYSNDSWPMTVMSYFDQRENDYYANLSFTRQYVVTPMLADVAAMGVLYGLSTTTRLGDTTYGFNSNAGRTVFDANLYPAVSYAIVDSGGIDTLDYSGFSQAQRISLVVETFSDVGGKVGNVTIGRGALIENAIGGGGNDQITGNNSNNALFGGAGIDTIYGHGGDDTISGGVGGDVLFGGAGSDTFRDVAASLANDNIADFTTADRIIVSDGVLAGFNVGLSGSLLTFSGGQITLSNFAGGTFVASAAAGGGVELRLQSSQQGSAVKAGGISGDFDGDGRDDVLLRHDNGTITDWLGQLNGGFSSNHAAATYGLDIGWRVAGTGDFNGDGRDDVLLRHANGTITDWLGQANGTFSSNHAIATYGLDNSWQIAATGDFNGDGHDDVLLRHNNGTITDWLGQANGTFSSNHAVASYGLDNSWQVAATGDFNGDGRDDVLLRHANGTITDWLGQTDGGLFSNHAAATYALDLGWKVTGTGDFNGDGRDDVLLRHANGTITDWLGQVSGGFESNHATATYGLDIGWQVAGTGDFNGDGRDDVLLRHANGTIIDWLGQINGGFSSNHAAATYGLDLSWQVQPDYLI